MLSHLLWDVSSALAFYDAGYRAVGTTSFGVTAVAGHPDGGRSSKEPASKLVTQLRNLPVYDSADVEDGDHDDPDVVAGINIEDTDEKLISPQAHAARVSAIKKRSPEVLSTPESLPYRAAIHAAVEVAHSVRNGVPPPAASTYPAMQARLVEFDGSTQTG